MMSQVSLQGKDFRKSGIGGQVFTYCLKFYWLPLSVLIKSLEECFALELITTKTRMSIF
jgi:hypothetical protein